MSSDLILFSAQSIYLDRCSVAASLTILYYDWLLTLPEEIRLFWKHKFSATSLLYYINRYASLLAHVPVGIEFYTVIPEESSSFKLNSPAHVNDSRKKLQAFHQLFSALSILITAVLLTLRTYALYGHSRIVLISLVTYMIVGFGVVIWAILMGEHLPGPDVCMVLSGSRACKSVLSDKQTFYLAIDLMAAMSYDIIIFCLTLYKCLRYRKHTSNRLITLMMRDGTMYFAFLIVGHTLNIISTLKYRDIIEVTTFSACTSSALISRLMLNLRNPNKPDVYSEEIIRTPMAFADPSASPRSDASDSMSFGMTTRSETTVNNHHSLA
ncbi:hypothetical protein K474DRAFT_1770934 [Panus rudis PR-1116 ss-1]|nr:hypothetical protein K474DRAFT_1770934 [Panus rudis PR-1116 ss-1]